MFIINKIMLVNHLKAFIIFGIIGFLLENLIFYNQFACGPFGTVQLTETCKICLNPFFFMYGIGGLVISIFSEKIKLNWVLKSLLYSVVFNVAELIGGEFMMKAICPLPGAQCRAAKGTRGWDYTDKPFNLLGHIDLEHTAYWFVLGFLGEWFYTNYIIKYTFIELISFLFLIYLTVTVVHCSKNRLLN